MRISSILAVHPLPGLAAGNQFDILLSLEHVPPQTAQIAGLPAELSDISTGRGWDSRAALLSATPINSRVKLSFGETHVLFRDFLGRPNAAAI